MTLIKKMPDLILKKREGLEHTEDEIRSIISWVVEGKIPDYQISAWLMACFLRGLTLQETTFLTEAMAFSGKILDLKSVGDNIVDKHSTGGVGDKTTMIIIPLLAACGVPVAKLSGRGLGYTGGTVDKLEAIPGFNTGLSMDQALSQLGSIGAFMGSQTADFAPADGILYALRDVTATVDSIPLIAASVLSKKIACGANIILLDVKYGSGAFMSNIEKATELAITMVKIGEALKRDVSAFITSMEQPLGYAVGNSLEIIESIETLKNQGPKDLEDLCIELSSVALCKAGKADSLENARQKLKKTLENGLALKKLEEIIKAQGGDTSIIYDYSLFPQTKYRKDVLSQNSGYIHECNALGIAKASKSLGAGRNTKEDQINLKVGVVIHKKVGDFVNSGEKLATIYADDNNLIQNAIDQVKESYLLKQSPSTPLPLIEKIIDSNSIKCID